MESIFDSSDKSVTNYWPTLPRVPRSPSFSCDIRTVDPSLIVCLARLNRSSEANGETPAHVLSFFSCACWVRMHFAGTYLSSRGTWVMGRLWVKRTSRSALMLLPMPLRMPWLNLLSKHYQLVWPVTSSRKSRHWVGQSSLSNRDKEASHCEVMLLRKKDQKIWACLRTTPGGDFSYGQTRAQPCRLVTSSNRNLCMFSTRLDILAV